jgi:drug/metabolite transporter (DMT)-like permease
MLSTFALGLLVIVVLVAAAASRRRLSPWWIFVAATFAAVIAIATSSDVASCDSTTSIQALFGYAAVIAFGLYATAAFTSLFDAVSLSRRGERHFAATRLVPLLLSAALAFGMFVLWLYAILSCIE